MEQTKNSIKLIKDIKRFHALSNFNKDETHEALMSWGGLTHFFEKIPHVLRYSQKLRGLWLCKCSADIATRSARHDTTDITLRTLTKENYKARLMMVIFLFTA